MAAEIRGATKLFSRSTDLLNTLADYTVSFWVRLDADKNNYSFLFVSINVPDNKYERIITAIDGTSIQAGNNNHEVDYGSDLVVGTWAYLTLVRSGTSLTVYLNGVSIGSETALLSGITAPTVQIVGANTTGGALPADMSIAYMRAWSTALSQPEILAEMQAKVAVRGANLHADWPMDNPNTLTQDISGNGRHWTDTGSVAYVDGPSLQLSIQFDEATESGTGDLLYRTTAPDYNSAYTFGLWAKITDTPVSDTGTLIRINNDATGTQNADVLLIFKSAGTFRTYIFARKDNVTLAASIAGPNLSPDTWHYFSLVRRSDTVLEAYVDGVLSASITTSSVAGRAASDRMYVGAYSLGGLLPVDGNLALLRMWADDLSAAELVDERNSPSSVRAASLWGEWSLTGYPSTIADVSGAGRNLTARNAPSLASSYLPHNWWLVIGAPDTDIAPFALRLVAVHYNHVRQPPPRIGGLRVGIDFDGNRWVDFSQKGPPNLIPYPLSFTALAHTETNATDTRKYERTAYGLFIRHISGDTTSEISALFGNNQTPAASVVGARTYTATLWVRSTSGGARLRLDVLDQTGQVLTATAVASIGATWTKLSIPVETDTDTTGLQLRLVRPGGEGSLCEVDVTGLGVYETNTTLDFKTEVEDSGEDITDAALMVAGDNGSNNDFTSMIPIEGELVVTLDNENLDWTPRNTESPYYGKLLPLTLVEVQFDRTGQGEWEPLWTGFYSRIALTTGETRDRQARLTATQGLIHLDESRVTYVPTLNQTTTEILQSILYGPPIPADRYTWKLGIAKLGINTQFASEDAFLDIDTSSVNHPAAGAGLTDNSTLRSFLNDLVRNDGGFAFFDRLGRLVFRARERLFPNIFE